MTDLFWHLRLTPSLTAVNIVLFTAETLQCMETGEWGAGLVLAVFGTCVPVSPSSER